MYLKRIELRGFKTFADRTELEFGPGITAIVGPNGVGKSNIADAILWVLGEQSHRALRTESSQDIIFAGTEKRRPLGMAEVGLTIDNSDGELALEFSEVTISRRLFRSGESEYLLNRGSARLRDIREVLLDTGIGPDTYSVVGQGEIDAILSIRSEDRRELLEEVAGIRKYRVRRDEATRKLQSTEGNVTRVADIVAELRSQREPLEKQAETARQYQALSERLRELDLHVLAADYQRRRARIGRLANELSITSADLQSTRNQMSQIDAEWERIQRDLARLADHVEGLRDKAAASERTLDQARQAQALADERLRAATTRQQDLEVVLDSLNRRTEELARQSAGVETEHEEVARAAEEAAAQAACLEAELADKAEALRAKQARVRELEAQQSSALERAAALENEALALEGLEADFLERAQRLSRQAEALAGREIELREAAAQARSRRDQLAGQEESLRQELQSLRQSLATSSRLLQEHRQKCNVFSGAVTHAEARQELLRELVHSHEGFGDGPRAVMQAAKEGHLTGIVGLVADLLDVPARFERAIEAALGDALQWIVTETEEQAFEGARYLQDAGAGRATFIPLSPAGPLSAVPPAEQTVPGSVGAALRTVGFRREHERLFARLLGDTIIVRDLDAACSVRQRLRTRCRLVTLTGEVVDAEGAVTAGGEEGAGTQVFLRRRELEQLGRDLDVMRTHLAQMFRREESLDRWCRKLTDDIHALEAQLSNVQSEQAAAAADLAHLTDQEKAARESSLELSEEARSLQERLQDARARRNAVQAEAESLRAQAEELAAQITRTRAAGVAPAEVEALRAEQVAAQVRAAELAEKQRALTSLQERYRAELERARAETAAAQAELAAARQVEEQLRLEAAAPAVDLAALEQAAGQARAAVTEGTRALSELREKAAELDSTRNRLNQVAQEQSDRIHRTELGLAREEAQLEAIVERLQETYRVSPEEALQMGVAELDEREVREEANRLREAIRALGPVNISAVDECERLRAREEFLVAQLEDLNAAREDLLQVIREIDEAATAEFLRAFAQVQVEFQSMFERLFGGGKTELRLSGSDKPLESGVDVIVQVPGKRQQNLLLLSGGERALTALALLFAMLRVRPTPFCVMDEIDAALDEANVGRFVEVLKDFARQSQFIIVTHNPHTIEAADVLFGVTMQEPGVSTLIKLELRDWEHFLSDAERNGAQAGSPRAGTRVLPVSS